MTRHAFRFALPLLFAGVLPCPAAVPPALTPYVVDDFQAAEPGAFPRSWKPYKDIGYRIMSVGAEGANRFLHVSSSSNGTYVGRALWSAGGRLYREAGEGRNEGFWLREFPVLAWRWRVVTLPSGGDERAKKSNDSGAAVAVVFKSGLTAYSLKYVWSASLPVGTILPSPSFMSGSTRIFVLRSGAENVGQWCTERRNVTADYLRAYGKLPDRPAKAIALLTDSDDTKSRAVADYDDVVLYGRE